MDTLIYQNMISPSLPLLGPERLPDVGGIYKRLFEDTAGMFNSLHLVATALFFMLLVLLLVLSRKMSARAAERTLLWLTIAVTVMEIIKIAVRIRRGLGPDSWVPLYFCSLFIFAVWLVRIPCEPLRRTGYAFITMGGITASVFFTFYPSTSLGMYPLISGATLHSFMYHLIMCYCGILVLWRGLYRPRAVDSAGYFIFIASACLASAVCNRHLGTNCMFLGHPFGLPLLEPLLELSPMLYRCTVTVAQGSLMFWANFGLYSLMAHLSAKRHQIDLSKPILH